MADDPTLVETARRIIADNLYMTLATADAAGRPWATPVYFAPVDDQELVWVSRPEARHSQNIAVRPDIGIVVFDSRVPISSGQGVYMSAAAELVPAAELDRCLEAYSRSCQDRGGSSWSTDDVRQGARLRLYRATASARWILDSHDQRVSLDPQATRWET